MYRQKQQQNVTDSSCTITFGDFDVCGKSGRRGCGTKTIGGCTIDLDNLNANQQSKVYDALAGRTSDNCSIVGFSGTRQQLGTTEPQRGTLSFENSPNPNVGADSLGLLFCTPNE
jgi:hypothetical protein